jgi:hypothetical protein
MFGHGSQGELNHGVSLYAIDEGQKRNPLSKQAYKDRQYC